jgi:hypothetical protein
VDVANTINATASVNLVIAGIVIEELPIAVPDAVPRLHPVHVVAVCEEVTVVVDAFYAYVNVGEGGGMREGGGEGRLRDYVEG